MTEKKDNSNEIIIHWVILTVIVCSFAGYGFDKFIFWMKLGYVLSSGFGVFFGATLFYILVMIRKLKKYDKELKKLKRRTKKK
jgi:ABC-type glycerol-3-phosphate transport system permease component